MSLEGHLAGPGYGSLAQSGYLTPIAVLWAKDIQEGVTLVGAWGTDLPEAQRGGSASCRGPELPTGPVNPADYRPLS